MMENTHDNGNNSTYVGEFDGRIGGTMQSALILLYNKDGVTKSMWDVASKLYNPSSTRYGYPVIHRCRYRGFMKIDYDHDMTDTRGAGALILTDKGRRYLNALDSDDN